MTEELLNVEIKKLVNRNNLPKPVMIHRNLERLFAIYQITMIDLLSKFTIDELCVLVDADGGVLLWDVESINKMEFVIGQVMLDEELFMKWKIYGSEMIGKLINLTLSEKVSLVDFVEQFWITASSKNDDVDIKKLVKQIFDELTQQCEVENQNN